MYIVSMSKDLSSALCGEFSLHNDRLRAERRAKNDAARTGESHYIVFLTATWVATAKTTTKVEIIDSSF